MEDPIPETAGDTKTILVIHEMMLKMILFQSSPVRWKCLVMQEIMRHVITDISKYGTAEYGCCCVPAVEEYHMSQLPEREGQHEE